MITSTPLPPQLAGLEGRVQFVTRVNENTYTMSCPNCGVLPEHNNNNPSDRFVVWMSSKLNGKPFGMCVRHCRFKWTPDKQDAEWSQEEKEEFKRKAREMIIAEDERVKKYAQDVIMKQAIYKRYAMQFGSSPVAKEYMHERGFTDDWLQYFGYGFDDGFKVSGRNSTYYSPAIIRPVMNIGGIVEQLKVRVIDAKCTQDRFRNIYKTKAQHIHIPLWRDGLKSKVFIAEGEMKADYVAMSGYVPKDISVIGVQGKGIGDRAYYQLENADVIYLCLDPDAFEPDKYGKVYAVDVAKRFGIDRTRFVIIRAKVDDAMNKGFNLGNAINMASKPQSFKYWR